MARRQPESRLTKRIIDAIGDEYPEAYIFKVHGGPYQMAGIPDVVACIDGQFVALEVKMPGREPTALQAEHIDMIVQAGGVSTYVTSVEEALDVLSPLRS